MEYLREISIDPLKLLEIGQNILVRPAKFKEKTFYYSNIQDIVDDKIYISVPSDDGGRPIGLKLKDLVEVAFTKNERRYGFFSEVTGKKLDPFFMLELKKPEKLFIVELRAYFRVPVFIPYTAKIVEKDAEGRYVIPKDIPLERVFFQGHIHDLSGGGAFITANIKLEVKTLFLMSFSIKETIFRDIPCQVVRKQILDKTKGREGYGVAFTDIDEKVREKIIKFCFARQRELRREGKL